MKKNTRKTIAVIISALMCIAVLPFAVSAEETVAIGTAQELYAYAADVNAGNSADAELTADITVDDSFTAIGTTEHPFTGSFNGNGYEISGISLEADGYAGLFGSADGATIEGVSVAGSFDCVSDDTAKYAGAIVAYAVETTVADCSVNATVYGDDSIGGVVGYAEKTTIDNCTTGATAYIGGYNTDCGGIVGTAVDSTVAACTNNAYIDGEANVGGIAGQAKNTDVALCTSNGTINANGNNAGGVVGYAGGTIAISVNKGSVSADNKAGGIAGSAKECEITESYNTGNVKVYDNYCAGIVAIMTESTISDCYNTGSVSGADSAFAGIFAMLNGGTVATSYNAGAVSGNCKTYAGIGSSVAGTVTNCYSIDTATKMFLSGSDAVVTGCALLSEGKMTAEEAFAGFDFENSWEIDDCHGFKYPELKAHNYHTLDYVSTVAPTCTAAGYDNNLCSVCNQFVETNEVPALDHTWETLSYKAATCTEAGYGDYECSVCGETNSEDFEATGHIDADNNNKCDNCGIVIDESKVPVKTNIFQKIGDFFRNIINWIKGLFNK